MPRLRLDKKVHTAGFEPMTFRLVGLEAIWLVTPKYVRGVYILFIDPTPDGRSLGVNLAPGWVFY